MYRYLPIRRIHGRQVLDSRGNPTVEVEVTVGEGIVGLNGWTGRSIVPSGASTGKFEAVELRDQEEIYNGKSVKKAVDMVNGTLAELLLGENALDQRNIDKIMCQEDGTENKEKFGANAILGISQAVAKASANALRIPLYRYLGNPQRTKMPIPMMNVLNGGAHADNTVDIQEFMLVPIGTRTFGERMRVCVETYHKLKDIVRKKGLHTGVGDEGGFAPDLRDAREALELLTEAVEQAGYKAGEDISFAIDTAASELYDDRKKAYYFPGESTVSTESTLRNSTKMIQYYEELQAQYPIISIEDGLQEEDWEGWKQMTDALGEKVNLVGDDLFVTNTNRLKKGIQSSIANAILIKPNQIGTVTETLETIDTAQRAGYRVILSHRSGDSEDPFIADLAVAVGAEYIKTGAPCRAERTSKYNQLLRIQEEMQN